MEPVGLGIDIVDLSRIRAALDRHGDRFLSRVYTEDERRHALSLEDPVSFLAGRFAVKEAVAKVLGTGMADGIAWRQIDVVTEPGGAPRVRLLGRALERAGELRLRKILVSISHGRDHAVAQALGVGGDG